MDFYTASKWNHHWRLSKKLLRASRTNCFENESTLLHNGESIAFIHQLRTLGYTKLMATRRRRGLVAQSLTLNRRVAIIRWKLHKSITVGEWVFSPWKTSCDVGYGSGEHVTRKSDSESFCKGKSCCKATISPDAVLLMPACFMVLFKQITCRCSICCTSIKGNSLVSRRFVAARSFVPIDVSLNKNVDKLNNERLLKAGMKHVDWTWTLDAISCTLARISATSIY